MFSPKPIWLTIVILSHHNTQPRNCLVTHILDENVIAWKHHISDARYCLGQYPHHKGLLMWELVPRPLPPKHPLTLNDIGHPIALTSRAITIFPLILGYKQRKRKEKKVVERFPRKQRVKQESESERGEAVSLSLCVENNPKQEILNPLCK